MGERDSLFEKYFQMIEAQRREIGKRIVGLEDVMNGIFVCFYSSSGWKLVPHLLVEGAVGTGKTLVLETFTSTIAEAKFKRIQFRADMMPIDLLEVRREKEDGTIEFQPGPLFANLILADEINRSNEKTRSALLEGMGEMQITLGVDTHRLEPPFFVMATQNPVDVEGTQPLGAAQLDRFMMKVTTRELTEEEELKIAQMHEQELPDVQAVLSKQDVLNIREFIRTQVYLDPKLLQEMVRLIRYLRPWRVSKEFVDPEEIRFSPEGIRGYLFLQRAVKVRAFLNHRDHVLPEDFYELVFMVLNHRIEFKYTISEQERATKVRELLGKALRQVTESGIKTISET